MIRSQKFRFACRGFLMIEVMVTMIILAVGLLGAAALQARSMQYAYASAQRTIATVQANDLVERMWASACELPDELNTVEEHWQNDWNTDPRFLSWDGQIAEPDDPDFPVYDITIKWTDGRVGPSAAEQQVFSYSASVPRLGCSL